MPLISDAQEQKKIHDCAGLLVKAQQIAVLTGAGISAESGVATFRDPDGLWAQFRPEELASMDGFLKNPDRVWQWYQARRDVLEKVQPNPGHKALATLQEYCRDAGKKYTLITQNVDRLHHRGGSTGVLELHGNIVENFCARCHKPHDYQYAQSPAQTEPPRCTYCGGQIRPAVVWFGEMLPADVFAEAEGASESCDVFLSIGTSAEVYPAAALPLLAKRSGATLVEINPNPTLLTSNADLVFGYAAGEILPRIMEVVTEKI